VTASRRLARERGQATVEAAISLPLVVFLFLGTLQLFLMHQGRILAEYAAFRATRVGSTNHANCQRMRDAAVLSVLPSVETYLGRGGAADDALVRSFQKYRSNRFDDTFTDGGKNLSYTGAIVWMQRSFTGGGSGGAQDTEFDQPGNLMRLETRLVFWFPLKIPFANWVMTNMFVGYRGLSPIQVTKVDTWEGVNLNNLAGEVRSRAARGEYVVPIEARYSMRMMTPLKAQNAGGWCL
jgi:hypothetical protein